MAEEQQGDPTVVVDGDRAITLQDLHDMQAAHRAEVEQLRNEISASRVSQPTQTANAPSAEEALANRLAEIANFPYYCPGCGALYHTQYTMCVGLDGSKPHAPIEVVSTDELKAGDPSKHTPAPATTT
jgi:hypothetical protein